ncbi:DUF4350 domain-containing protein [Gracilibacillus phocaeensis]|uniref:DUF4350 domain-containing protein n=1 Tax=Gracilibacillus phocaeensis TaxID=2042304 RepID=UPI001031435F|nr:DUF4350 domain-containing protein [Gracilibacillus phocaeensis]
MFGKKTWIIGAVFFLLLIGVSMLTANQTPTQYPPYLVDSPSPTGLKALYTYLEDNEYDVQQAEGLSDSTDHSLRMMVNPDLPSDQSVEDAYQSYIEAGNTVVLAKENPQDFFGVNTIMTGQSLSNEPVEIFHHEQPLTVSLQSDMAIEPEENDHVLLTTSDDQVIALERPIGEGSLIVLTEPNWLTNEGITAQDQTDAVFATIPFDQQPSIVFDEFSAADIGSVSPFDLYPGWAYVLLVQGIILAIFILWKQGKRFGPVYPVREETVRLSDERIQAIAIWQTKGKNYTAAIQNQLTYLKEAVRLRYGLPHHDSWEVRLNLLKKKQTSLSTQQVQQLSQRFTAVEDNLPIHKQEFLALSQTIDTIRKEVEET